MKRVGEVFKHDRVTLKVINQSGCEACYFNTYGRIGCDRPRPTELYLCASTQRADGLSVQFMRIYKFKFGK